MEEIQTRLRPLAMQAIEHWKEFLPNKYAALKEAGMLNSEALKAAEMTLDEEAQLIAQGFPPEAAWEVVREKYVFQPEWEDYEGEEDETDYEEPPESEGYRLNLELNSIMSNLHDEEGLDRVLDAQDGADKKAADKSSP